MRVQSPKQETEGGNVELRHLRLREDRRRERGEQDGAKGGGAVSEAAGDEPKGGESEGCDDQHSRAGEHRIERVGRGAGEPPDGSQVEHDERRVGVAERGGGDWIAGEENVPGGGNEVAGFVPEKGQAQPRQVGEPQGGKDGGEGGEGRAR